MELGLEDLFAEPPPKISAKAPHLYPHEAAKDCNKRPHDNDETNSTGNVNEIKRSNGNDCLGSCLASPTQKSERSSGLAMTDTLVPNVDRGLQICRAKEGKVFVADNDERKEMLRNYPNEANLMSNKDMNNLKTSSSSTTIRPSWRSDGLKTFEEHNTVYNSGQNKNTLCLYEYKFNNNLKSNLKRCKDKPTQLGISKTNIKRFSKKKFVNGMVGPKAIKRVVERNGDDVEFFGNPTERPHISYHEPQADLQCFVGTLHSRQKNLQKKAKKKRSKERKKKKEQELKNISVIGNRPDIELGPPKCITPHKWPVPKKQLKNEAEKTKNEGDAKSIVHVEEENKTTSGTQVLFKKWTGNTSKKFVQKVTKAKNDHLADKSKERTDPKLKDSNFPVGSKRGGQKRKKRARNVSSGSNLHQRETQPKVLCKYFLDGRCRQGGECQFLHEGTPQRRELCRYYVTDSCIADKCIFMHDEFPCKYFHTIQRCNNGEACKYSHKPLNDETGQLLNQLLARDHAIQEAARARDTEDSPGGAGDDVKEPDTAAEEISLGVSQETTKSDLKMPNLYESLI